MTSLHGMTVPVRRSAAAVIFACFAILLQGCTREQLCKTTISAALTGVDSHIEQLIDAGCEKAVHGSQKCLDFAKDIADCFHLEKAAIQATIVTECVEFKGNSAGPNATAGSEIYAWIASQSKKGSPLHELYKEIINDCMSNHSMSASKAAAVASKALSEPSGASDSKASGSVVNAGIVNASDVGDNMTRLFEEGARAEASRRLSIAGYMACIPVVAVSGFAMVVLRIGLRYVASGASYTMDDPEDLARLVSSESDDDDE